MAKTNIVFNNASYTIDESSLSAATAELQSHLSIAQWNAIEKGDNWDVGVPATHVQCSDGQVAL